MTSQKERDFVRHPLRASAWKYMGYDRGDTLVGEVGGISEAAERALTDRGYEYAYQLLGKFLMLRMDEELFTLWLRDLLKEEGVGLPDRYLESAYNSLKGWLDIHD